MVWITGTDPRGQTEHVVIDKSAVVSMAPRGTRNLPRPEVRRN